MITEITSEFLNLGENPLVDNSIDKIEPYEIKIANPNTELNPRFRVDYTDQWVLPCEAYLQLTGSIVKANDTAYAAADLIAFVNNGLMHMFDRAEYKIDNQIIERIEKPGIATLITSLVDYPDDYIRGMGDQLMFAKDTAANTAANTNDGFVARKEYKKFDVCIPLSHVFRFAREVKKVVYGMTHSIEFVRAIDSNNAIHRADAAGAGKVNFENMSLWMPRVIPSPKSLNKLLTFMKSKKVVQAPFRQLKFYDKAFENVTDITWEISSFSPTDRPRHVFVALQLRSKEGDQKENNSVFDPCALTDISLMVNGEQFPRFPYGVDFTNGKIARPFRELVNYRGIDNFYDSGMQITKQDFLKRYPIYHFDLERLPESINNSVSSMQLRARLNAGEPFRVLVAVLADKDLSFTSDGTKMVVSSN